METVMRLVMCNWTWSHFTWEYSDLTRLDFTWRSRQTSRAQFAQRPSFWEQQAQAVEHFSEPLFPNGCMSNAAVCTLLLCPQKTTINPHTAFWQRTPPLLGLFCPLELSLHEEDKNTAPWEFMGPAELPLKIQTSSDICSESQVRKQSNHSVYTATAT